MSDKMPSYRLITAGILLLAYLVFAGVLLGQLYSVPKDKAPDWNNVLVVFNAIGALATAAVGVLLGVEVQQANVDSAQKRAEQSAAEAARKSTGILAALGSLEGTASQAATSADPGIRAARVALHAALATGALQPG
jgi:cytochrome bd-type quinol oxidase subunit 2